MLRMILVIKKHLKSYLKTFILKKMTINDAEQTQCEFDSVLSSSSNYAPRDGKYIEAENGLLNNARNLYERREKIIKGFKDGIFLLNHDDAFD